MGIAEDEIRGASYVDYVNCVPKGAAAWLIKKAGVESLRHRLLSGGKLTPLEPEKRPLSAPLIDAGRWLRESGINRLALKFHGRPTAKNRFEFMSMLSLGE